jgi:hypothetical protein
VATKSTAATLSGAGETKGEGRGKRGWRWGKTGARDFEFRLADFESKEPAEGETGKRQGKRREGRVRESANAEMGRGQGDLTV